jgi:hypothetical protein
MNTYSFIIGSCDDFETGDDLLQYFQNGGSNLNASRFDYDLSASASQETILMVGRGHAFSNDWCMDDTISMVCQSIEIDFIDVSTLPFDELLTAYAEMHGRHNTRGTQKRIYVNGEGKWSVEYSFRGRFGGVCGGFCLRVPIEDDDEFTRKEVENIIRQIVGSE